MARRVLCSGVLLIALTFAAPAEASRAPTKAEAKAIKKGFLKGRSAKATTIRRIRVSTARDGWAAVSYTVEARTSKKVKAPTPVVLKKSGSKWKDVPPGKAPKKVKSDLKVPPATSNVKLTGEVVDRVQARRPLQRLRGEHLRPRRRPAAEHPAVA